MCYNLNSPSLSLLNHFSSDITKPPELPRGNGTALIQSRSTVRTNGCSATFCMKVDVAFNIPREAIAFNFPSIRTCSEGNHSVDVILQLRVLRKLCDVE